MAMDIDVDVVVHVMLLEIHIPYGHADARHFNKAASEDVNDDDVATIVV